MTVRMGTDLEDFLTPHSSQSPTDFHSSNLTSLSPEDAAQFLYCDSEILAPMVRASTVPLRTLALCHGASLVYTEELVDRSIFPTERIVNVELGTIDYRTPKQNYPAKVQKRMEMDKDNPDSKNGAILLRIDPVKERDKLILQIGTGQSHFALQAAEIVSNDVAGFDINMGCPKKFSVSGGMGSALLSDVKRACDIISTLRRNLCKPVSAKIRLLDPTDPRPTLDFVRALINAGVNAVTIHGRIVGDESHTMARWETLVDVVSKLKQTQTVPIIINGDLYTRADIREMKRKSGCDGVMLARPALYNVSIFRKTDRGIPIAGDVVTNGSDLDSIKLDEGEHTNNDVSLSQFQAINHSGYYGYHSPLLHSRTSVVQEYITHCVRYRTHSKNAKYVVCEMMNSRRAPMNRVPFLNMEYPGGQTISTVCKCRSLDDLIKIWDVKGTIPFSSYMENRIDGICSTSRMIEELGDRHKYDDNYFLNPETFQLEKNESVVDEISLTSSRREECIGNYDENKVLPDCSTCVPSAKRPKI